MPAGLLLVGLTGCALFRPPAPLPPPYGFTGEVTVNRGVALQRRTSVSSIPEADRDPANAQRLNLRVYQVERLPSNSLPALAARADLVASELTDSPIQYSSYLTEGGRVGLGDSVRQLEFALRDGKGGRWSLLLEHGLALPVGLSAEVDLSARVEAPRPQDYPRTPDVVNPPHNRVRFNVGREDGETYTVVVAMTDVRPRRAVLDLEDAYGTETPAPVDETPQGPAIEVVVSEVVPVLGQGPFALCVPSPFAGKADALVFCVDVEPAPDPAASEAIWSEHVAATELALSEGASSYDAALDRARPISSDAARLITRQLAVAGIRENPERVSLIYVTGTLQAPTATDLVLVGSDQELMEFVDEALPEESVVSGELSLEELGWMFDRAALRTMSRNYGQGTLSPELRGVLLRHTGEAGRFPSMVQDAVKACTDRDQLEERLIAENRLFLEDSAPSARVRAYDWLRSRDSAPEGFDPLASRDDRRAVLEIERERLRDLARAEEAADLAEAEALEAVTTAEGDTE